MKTTVHEQQEKYKIKLFTMFCPVHTTRKGNKNWKETENSLFTYDMIIFIEKSK